MKILIVSYFFPPFNAVGAIRLGKFAKYLTQAGHEVKVLSADHQPLSSSLPVEVDENNIFRTAWLDVNKPIQILLGGKKSIATKGFERAGCMPVFMKKLGYYYKDLINFPDGQIGWYPFAMKAGKKILQQWKPDFILGSANPYTSFLIAKKLSKLFNIPWIADLRDLWADNHNADIYESRLRRLVNRKIEKHVLADANALITVSEPLADILKNKFHQPIWVINNGYDFGDYPEPDEMRDPSGFRIVYTGIIHPQKRDPTPLFQAVNQLGKDASQIQIDFYGKNNAIIKKLAIEHGLDKIVNCHPSISYAESLKNQVNADLLLLLIDNSEKEKGVMTSKFFEYLGARRPIVFLGCVDGCAAKIIKERNIGIASNDPTEIAAFLKSCIDQKQQGKSHRLSPDLVSGFSRQEQALQLADLLNSVNL